MTPLHHTPTFVPGEWVSDMVYLARRWGLRPGEHGAVAKVATDDRCDSWAVLYPEEAARFEQTLVTFAVGEDARQ